MNRIWQTFLGIERLARHHRRRHPAGAHGAAEGGGRPRADRGGGPAAGVLLWVLYRRERRDLSRARRGVLVGLRVAHPAGRRGHAGRAGAGLHPARDRAVAPGAHPRRLGEHDVLRPVHRRLPRGGDRRGLAAPVRGRAVARASGSGRRRGWTSSRRPSARTWRRWHAAGSCTSTTSNPRRGRGRAGRSGRGSSTRSSRSGRCLRWAMRSRACWRRTGASRSPAWSWRPTGGPTRGRTRSAPWRRRSARTSRSTPIAAGADEGPRNVRLAEIEASPVVFARDPMTLAVVVEARGLRDAEATVVLERRINEGDWEPVGNQRIALGEDGILKRTTFRIVPEVVGQYEFRARVEDAGPELTLEDNVANAAVKVVRQQIRVLLIAGGPIARGAVPPQRPDARPARRVRRLAPARRPGLPAGGRPADPPAAERARRS